ncbi:MAG: tRNA lysidine(34) synthetase TilS [Deltaproteobacteria bacterium]|nr:tRNA lysidine(34) synthetase TilS [Deltaproteobacteria bacterium]
MLNRVKKTIDKFKMLEKGDKILAAVSGGIDSVVLLHVLMKLQDKYNLDLSVIHLNHSMRGKESKRDFVFVKTLAKNMGLKFIGKTIDVPKMIKKEKGSKQDIARKVRYKFFEDAAKKYGADKIATAHTLDDNAETVLMRIIKGTSLKGLKGIPFVRDKFIRPLLEIERLDIEKYAKENSIKYIEDSSNKKTKYFRNKVRLKLLPILQTYNPNIKKELARLAMSVKRDEDYLEQEADKAYKKALLEASEKRILFNLDRIRKLPDALNTRIFLSAIECLKGESGGIYSYHLEDILELIDSNAPQSSINLPKNIVVQKEYDRLIFAKDTQKAEDRKQKAVYERLLNIPGNTNIKEIGIKFRTSIVSPKAFKPSANENTAYFDYDRLSLPLVVRNFSTGDRFKPFGMNGSKKIKDLFIEKKMPLHLRKKTPIIVSGKEIIWVAGVRRGDAAKVEKNTRKILMIHFSQNPI